MKTHRTLRTAHQPLPTFPGLGLLLLCLLALQTSAVHGQTYSPIRVFEFNGTYSDTNGSTVSMVPNGGTLNSTSYTFAAGQGLSLEPSVQIPTNYSIEMVFSLSSIPTYACLVNFNNLTADAGIYLWNGIPYFAPSGGSPTSPVISANQTVRLVITRNLTDQITRIYVNGTLANSRTDTANNYVFPSGFLHFFRDDGTENAPGTVDSIRFFNQELDASDVAALVNPPTVTSVTPSSGGTGGNTDITITGTGFNNTVKAVTIGGVAATSVYVVNSTSLTCRTPARTSGAKSVQVINFAGTNATNSLFTYVAMTPPTVTSPTATGTTPTSVTLGGTVTSDGGATITERGIVFADTATNNNPEIGGTGVTKVTASGTTGVFTVDVTGLSVATYYSFKAYATNSQGTSYAVATHISTRAATVPSAPTIGTATGGNASAAVAFVAPASNGGSAITGYTVTSNPGGLTGTGAASPITVNGLTNGTTYTFTVTASNAVGTGPASAASNSVTPANTPTVTSPTSASVASTSATLGGSVTSDGGVTITERGVVYARTSVNANPLIGATGVTKVPVAGTTGTFSTNVGSLTGVTGYTFKAYAINSLGTGYTGSATFTTLASVPDAPAVGTATPGNASASITFTPPVNNGGSAITGYTVTSSPGGFVGTGATSPIIVSGLSNGTAYTFTVTATNTAGQSAASAASNSVTPTAAPGAPTIGTATPGNASASVTFTAPASNGGSGITSYTVTSSPGGLTGSGATSPITVTGLTNGTAYTFSVKATNAVGSGAASAASNSVTPAALPTVTSATSTSILASSARLGGTVSSDGGAAIIERGVVYSVTTTNSNPQIGGAGVTKIMASQTTSVFAEDVFGLNGATGYSFKAYATNSIGTSYSSVATFSTPAQPPDWPSISQVIAANASAVIFFDAPSSNGGSPITSYTVTSNPGGLTASGASSPITVTGLTNGVGYRFTVVATNSAGSSGSSNESDLVKPGTLPGAPTIGTAIRGSASASVAFTAPASDGGSPIINYTATSSPGGITASGTTSPLTVNGLTNGTAYTFTVAATNAFGTGASSAASNSVTPALVPTITSVAPNAGPPTGGTSITITGLNFATGATVTIGGSAAKNVVVVNATTINCTTPAGSVGGKSVVVTTSVGANPANTLFMYDTPPVANAQSVILNEDKGKLITLAGTDADPKSSLSYIIVTPPAHGTLIGSGPFQVYSPAANYNGADSFTFKVHDGILESAPATVKLTINSMAEPDLSGPPFLTFDEAGQMDSSISGWVKTVPLTNGNVVMVFLEYGGNGFYRGAVCLFNGSTGDLISTLVGARSGDGVGSGGVVALPNGNYVVCSPEWNNGSTEDVGAVTWCNGSTGINGPVTAANSLIGLQGSDHVGQDGVKALTNGNYVVVSALWDNGTIVDAGAVTWGNGSTGTTGTVSAANSLVGTGGLDGLGGENGDSPF